MASGYASYANRCESRERSKRHHSACHVVNCRNRRDCTVHLAKPGHSQGRSPSWRSRIPSLAGDSHGAGSRRGGGCNCPSLLLAGYDVLDHFPRVFVPVRERNQCGDASFWFWIKQGSRRPRSGCWKCEGLERWWRRRRSRAEDEENPCRYCRKLAVRQGFEPWIQLLGRITV